tara:strand:- start:1848 stop:1973 length:126 start_codon:yes stop_codon:yes gene_type:complete
MIYKDFLNNYNMVLVGLMVVELMEEKMVEMMEEVMEEVMED